MRKNLSVFILFTSFLCFSQNKENGVLFIKTLLLEKDFKTAYSFFDESIKTKISEDILQKTIQQLETQLGKFKTIIEVNNENNAYHYFSEFEKTKLDIKITFNENNKIIGFFFVPHKEFKKENSLGKDFNIKSNDIELKGTLLVPENDNLKKLVIFVHGSGPEDRDETISVNKPFKDIAESLYSKGIASYRFDKRSFSNPESFKNNSTVDDEVTNDILNIINYFENDLKFKEYQIIVLGHSLGAHLAPRIANKSKIDKIVLLAGNARPLQQLIIEQYEYLNKINPSKDLENEITKVKEQVAILNSKDFNLNTPKEKLPFNLTAYYWKSMLDYNPLKEVKRVKIPILILQGERDYQVTMQDFELWKNTLKANKKASCISYPKLNHLFVTGESPSEPKEYSIKGNVDSNVINDISNFIIKK
jgi:uncharacterized protein